MGGCSYGECVGVGVRRRREGEEEEWERRGSWMEEEVCGVGEWQEEEEREQGGSVLLILHEIESAAGHVNPLQCQGRCPALQLPASNRDLRAVGGARALTSTFQPHSPYHALQRLPWLVGERLGLPHSGDLSTRSRQPATLTVCSRGRTIAPSSPPHRPHTHTPPPLWTP